MYQSSRKFFGKRNPFLQRATVIVSEMVTIIDYGAGNVFSVQTAIRRLNEEVIISSDPSVILEAERVIFPGVGQAAAAMRQLREKGLDKIIPN